MPNGNRNPIPPPVMSVMSHSLFHDTHEWFSVTFDSHTIQTLVTSEPSSVDSWLHETLTIHHDPLRPLIAGLSIEWLRREIVPSIRNPVATLQLCIEHRCLVFQLLHTLHIPESLLSFLTNRNHTFFGVSINVHAEKLANDNNIRVANRVELHSLVNNVSRDPLMLWASLRTLSQSVLGRDYDKPLGIVLSRWDSAHLSPEQVQYATVDAFLSFEIGRRLSSLWL